MTESRLVKSFTAGAAIEPHIPVTVVDNKVVAVTSPFQLVKGVTMHKASAGSTVDVPMFGEGFCGNLESDNRCKNAYRHR